MTPIQFPLTIESISTRKDNTLKIVIGTQEMKDEDASKVMTLRNQFLWGAFCPTEIQYEDLKVPEVVPEFKGDKSPSQRLRNVLFVLHGQLKEKSDFEIWYKGKMEEIISYYKEKLV